MQKDLNPQQRSERPGYGMKTGERGPATKEKRDSATARPLRVALLGAGQMGRHHARALSKIEIRNEIVAVIDPDRTAREHLLELCPLARGRAAPEEAFLHDDVDIVHICTPPPTHARLCRAALEAGCHAYVEKPFATAEADARQVLSLAKQRNLRVCAGHQLLWERPTRQIRELLRSLGQLSHVESFFSFRPARRGMSADEQLKDVLPHPLYLLLHLLEVASPSSSPQLQAIRVGGDGTVHASVESAGLVGSIVLTLTGRPVANYLKVVGTNGTAEADYVRGIVTRAIGPGSSAIDKVLDPFRKARQLTFGTAGSLARRIVRGERSYPGLADLFGAFYGSIRHGTPSPLPDEHLLNTVRFFQQIAEEIDRSGHTTQTRTSNRPPLASSETPRRGAEGVVVTGGTGFLGREVVRHLTAAGIPTRVLARRLPAGWERVDGVEYQAADLGAGCPPHPLEGSSVVIHCAAETAGGWADHQRNSIDATKALLRAAESAGVTRIVHISSIAVLERPVNKAAICEGVGLKSNDRAAGPYVWGKLNAERAAKHLAGELGIRVKIARPGAIIDYESFSPPGRLGRRLGNLFVAVGPRSEEIPAVDLKFAARTILWMVQNFENTPEELNLLDPELPTRERLVEHLKKRNPDLRVLWLPRVGVKILSRLGVLLQRVVRPGKQPLHVDRAFLSEPYDNSRIRSLADKISERTVSPS